MFCRPGRALAYRRDFLLRRRMVVQDDAQKPGRMALLLRRVIVPAWLEITLTAVWADSVRVRFLAHPMRTVVMVALAMMCGAVIIWLMWRLAAQPVGAGIKAELRSAPHFGARLAVVWRWYRTVQLWWLIWMILAATTALLNILGVIAVP